MLLLILGLLLLAAAGLRYWLQGADLSAFDNGYPPPIAGSDVNDGMRVATQSVMAFTGATKGMKPGRKRIMALRDALDSIADDKQLGANFMASREGEPHGEWVLTENTDLSRRLLYVHGGGFVAGSPRSHRVITSKLAQLTGMAVFALDYRLVPEHSRLAGLEDTVNAFAWLTEHNPDGPSASQFTAIAGDSAGGNLTLATAQRLRDTGRKNANALVGICPSTDVTLCSPSMRVNQSSDLMLGGALAPLLRLPRLARLLLLAAIGRRSPASPVLSPLRGDLSDLPPILLQVSLTEMLLDDAARYFHRARAVGAPVTLQTYDNMVHVWHMFAAELPEATMAFEGIADFLCQCESEGGQLTVSTKVQDR